MLAELRIENFAIIDLLELHFSPGLVIFTGETGAGKSIIIDAVETLLGGRADTTMIRTGADRAQIEATFRLSLDMRADLHSILEREELLDDSEHLNLSREIRAAGRNIARVNGRAVNVSILRELGEFLIDVHGQSEHLSLLRVREHLNLLDRFASTDSLLQDYSHTFQRLEAVRRELKELRQLERDSVRRADLLAYQINEIESARLEAGEVEELLAERTRLANAEELTTIVQDALLALDEGAPDAPSAIDLFGRLVDGLTHLSRLDPSQSGISRLSQELFEQMSDISRTLRNYLEEIEFNPKRLDQVEDRLALIDNLKRKYGDSIPAILSYAADSRKQQEAIFQAGDRIAELEDEEKSLLDTLSIKAQNLSRERQSAAKKLEIELETELNDLHMPEARFVVDFQQQSDQNGVPNEDGRVVAFDSTGFDQVEFLIAPNPGEGLKPLVKIASGGETSRLMLAIKNVLNRADQVPSLIFDEIDQGIGGRVGTIVGYKLWLLARHHQVLCITHLPQLAAFGEQHFQVEKQIISGRTLTIVKDLINEDRVVELAQMMGETSDGTLQSANEIMKSAQDMTAHNKV